MLVLPLLVNLSFLVNVLPFMSNISKHFQGFKLCVIGWTHLWTLTRPLKQHLIDN